MTPGKNIGSPLQHFENQQDEETKRIAAARGDAAEVMNNSSSNSGSNVRERSKTLITRNKRSLYIRCLLNRTKHSNLHRI